MLLLFDNPSPFTACLDPILSMDKHNAVYRRGFVCENESYF